MRLPKLVVGLVALALVAAVVAGVVVATNGGDEEPEIDLDAIAAASRAAGPAHYTGEIGSPRFGEGPIDGRYDLEAQEWAVTYPTLAGDPIDVEVRRLGDTLYIERPAGPRPWVRSGLDSRLAQHVLPLDPVEVLDALAESEVTVEERAEEEVGGEAATRYRLSVFKSAQEASLSAASQRQFGINSSPFPALRGGSEVELWVDGADRLVRLRIMAATFTSDVEVGEYGAAVAVEAPPEAETMALRDAQQTTPIEPAGEFETVASGTTEGVEWALERAPGERETDCFRLRTAEPFPIAGDTAPKQDPDEADGTICVDVLTDESLQFEELFQSLLVGSGTPGPDGLDVFVARVPEGVTEVRLGFSGGTTQTWPVTDGYVVWFGPLDPALGWVGITDAEGFDYDCAPGPIFDLAQLRDLEAGSVLAARGYEWTCLPKI